MHSENIYFSNDRAVAKQDITVTAETLYWASNISLVAKNVPVNFFATYPGTSPQLIGRTTIASLSAGSPDSGSKYVFMSWRNGGDGFYPMEARVDPAYTEGDMLNNAATGAIPVGALAGNMGVVTGHVSDLPTNLPPSCKCQDAAVSTDAAGCSGMQSLRHTSASPMQLGSGA